jgi:hypothetical protein
MTPRPLNAPVCIAVRVDPAGEPRAIGLPGPWDRRRPIPVMRVAERWRIDEGWWGPNPLSRLYYRLVLADGRLVTVYRDLDDGTWWAQRS